MNVERNTSGRMQKIEICFGNIQKQLNIPVRVYHEKYNSYEKVLEESYTFYEKEEYSKSFKKLGKYNSQCFCVNAGIFAFAFKVYSSLGKHELAEKYKILDDIDPFQGDLYEIDAKLKILQVSFQEESNIFLWKELYCVLLYNDFSDSLKEIHDIRAHIIILLHDFINNDKTFSKEYYKKYHKCSDNIFFSLFLFLYAGVFHDELKSKEKINNAHNILQRENMLFNLFNDYKTSYEFAYYTLSQELNEPAHKLYYFLRFIVESYDIFPVQIKDERKRLISLLSEVGIKDDKDLKNSIFYPVINIFFENILFDVESIEGQGYQVSRDFLRMIFKYMSLGFNLLFFLTIGVFIIIIFFG